MSLFDSVLPRGRRWARVGDFYEVTRKPRHVNLRAYATIPFVPMEAVPQGGQYEARYEDRPAGSLTSGTYFERGDLLIAKITPSFENGKQALTDNLLTRFGYATTEVIPLRASLPGQDKRLLFFYLLHPEVRSFVAERMEGSTGRQRVPEAVLLDLPYPEFPSEDQRHIGDALERICRAIQLEASSRMEAHLFKHAAMRQLFSHGLLGETWKETEIGAMPGNWTPKPLLELCQIWSGGTPRKSVAAYWSGTTPWVSGKDLKAPSLDDSIDHVSDEGVIAGTRLAPAGSVLILVRGMGLAKDLPVSVITRPMAFNQDVKALVPEDPAIGSFLRSAIYVGKERLLSRCVRSAHGTMTLNLNDLEEFCVPWPDDMDEAKAIVKVLDVIDRLIDLRKQKGIVLADLFKTLLHKLITGEVAMNEMRFSALAYEAPLALEPAL